MEMSDEATGQERSKVSDKKGKEKHVLINPVRRVLQDTDKGMKEDARTTMRAFKGQGQEEGQFIRGGGRGQAGVGRPRPPSYCATTLPTTPVSRPLPVTPTWA